MAQRAISQGQVYASYASSCLGILANPYASETIRWTVPSYRQTRRIQLFSHSSKVGLLKHQRNMVTAAAQRGLDSERASMSTMVRQTDGHHTRHVCITRRGETMGRRPSSQHRLTNTDGIDQRPHSLGLCRTNPPAPARRIHPRLDTPYSLRIAFRAGLRRRRDALVSPR